MRLKSHILLFLIIFLTFSSLQAIGVNADPPMGDDPQQKYPFLHDPTFDEEDSAYGSSYCAPARGTTYDSGQWYCGLTFHYSSSMYSKIENNRLKLYSQKVGGDIAYIPVYWASAWAEQGRGPYGAIQYGFFKGSNDTEANSVDSPRIVFPMNDTIPNSGSQNGGEGTEIWLIIKARLTKRDLIPGHTGPPTVASANLGFFCGFQYEFWNGTDYSLSDYDKENPKGSRNYALHYDMFLSRMYWVSGIPDESNIGWEQIDAIPTNPYDDDIRAQRVVGQMDVGIWYTFKLDFGYLIERLKDGVEGIDGENDTLGLYQLPDVTALVLRALQIFAESCSAEIEAELQYCLLSENELSLSTATVRSYAWKNDEWINIPTSMYFDDEFRFGTSILYLTALKNGWHELEALRKIGIRGVTYWRGYKFLKWEIKGTNYTANPKWVWFNNNFNINLYYEYFNQYSPPGGRGGGGGLMNFRRFCTYSPDQISEYGFAINTNTSYIDQYSRITIRKTLGNTNGTIAFDVWTSEQEIKLDTLNIEEVQVNLGQIWDENGRVNFFNPLGLYVDDITLRANIQNVSSCDIVFYDVPQVNKICKNHIEMQEGDFWEYKDGNLIIHLEFGDPDIEIDFETPFSFWIPWIIIFFCLGICILCIKNYLM